MSDLKLDSLRIQNFRAFSDLQIEQLGRVNLIVGKNNTGKTSLLEAIHLYVSYHSRTVIGEIVRQRDLADLDKSRRRDKSEYEVDLPPERHLIHDRPSLNALAKGDSLDHYPVVKITTTPESNASLTLRVVLESGRIEADLVPRVEGDRSTQSVFGDDRVKSIFVRPLIKESNINVGEIWDRIELLPGEKRVIKALQIIDPRVRDVAVKNRDPEGAKGRIPLVGIEGAMEPESMRNLGEGMNRLFELSLALVDAEDGVLLIDEVENGLHHTVHGDVWKLIFQTARDLNVQVFATTHSYDALKAFEKVANEHEDEEGMLVQLRRRRVEPHDIAAVTANEEELAGALQSHVDPR